MKRKLWISLTIICVLAAACTPRMEMIGPLETPTPGDPNAPTPTPVETGVSILVDGAVQTSHPALPLAFESSGKLLSVEVQAGDSVRKGDVLAKLEESASLDSYQAAVSSAELAVLRAQQALDDLNDNAEIVRTQTMNNIATYAKAVRDAQFQLENFTLPTYLQGMEVIEALNLMKERLDAASQAFEPYRYAKIDNAVRQERLRALNEAQSQYDAAVKHLNYEYDLQAAQANLDKALKDYQETTAGPAPDELTLAQAELGNAQAQLALAKNDLEKAAERAALVAPMDGIVLSVDATPGALVGSGSPIVTLLDTSKLEFQTTNLSERDLALVLPGQKALVTLKTYPDQPIEASVVRIGWQVGALVGDAATFPIVLVLSQTGLDIRPGMTGKAEIK